MIKYLENANFDDAIKEKKVLVDFYADWCGPCKMMGNVLDEINEIDILKVNVDKYKNLSQKFGVMSIPTLILFENGKPIKKSVGFMDIMNIKEFIR